MTKSELQCMLNLWNLDTRGGFVRDIQEGFEEPRPAYTTTATFMKILCRKGFCKDERVGSMQYYTPLISKQDYCRKVLAKVQHDYFDGDVSAFVDFLLETNDVKQDVREDVVAKLR